MKIFVGAGQLQPSVLVSHEVREGICSLFLLQMGKNALITRGSYRGHDKPVEPGVKKRLQHDPALCSCRVINVT